MAAPPPRFDALPPQNLEAEVAVLGALLVDNGLFEEILGFLGPGDFYRDSHAELFRVMRAMHERGVPVDGLALRDEVERLGIGDRVDGDSLIWQALEETPCVVNGVYYAQIVLQRAVARNLLEACHKTIRAVYSNNFTSDELVRDHEAELSRVADGRRSREPVTLLEACRDSIRRFDMRLAGEEPGVTTGLLGLDEIAGGFQPAQLIVLGARPGLGKTALALNVAEYVAKIYGPVMFFSLEMGMGELGDRTVCGLTETDSVEYRKADRLRARRDWFARRVEEMGDVPVYIDDTPDMTPRQVTASARRMAKRPAGLRLVIVDYLQIVGSDNPKDTEYTRVGEAARALKNLAKLAGCPVLALSQLSRKCEERPDKRPMMSDLRATGQIEQDADKILFIYREEKYFPGKSPGEAEIIVAKNRAGAEGVARVAFDRRLTRFRDLADAPDPDADHPF